MFGLVIAQTDVGAKTGTYNASKFAVIRILQALAQEAKTFGISVNIIVRGMFRTNFMTNTTLRCCKKCNCKLWFGATSQHVAKF
ncbi:MAG: SDR family NAD(P)-dependent oxidoreductase [Sphingobacteriaceae bacterium]|nr:MAG: SDR family NAD(P)-dependent oxidoreductase [Sphingobacteriaceae bacterium]